MNVLGGNELPNTDDAIKAHNFQTPMSKDNSQEQKNFTLRIYKGKTVQICKPLIWLKLALFLWFAGSTSARTFFTLFLKQRGLSILEISFIDMLTPVVQIACTSLLSILADKIGRSKPILIGSILFTTATALVLNLIPYDQKNTSQTQEFTVECMEFNMTIAKGECWLEDRIVQLSSCEIFCPGHVKTFKSQSENMEWSIFKQDIIQNNSSNALFNKAQLLNGTCIYATRNFSLSSDFLTICQKSPENFCQISCIIRDLPSRSHSAWVYIFLSLLFYVSFGNVFRFFDITVMAMVKDHGADYGRHRFFSSFGHLVGPLLSGYIVVLTTPEGEKSFYGASFYAYAVFCFLTALVVLKVDVRAQGRGKHMWKKSLVLMKNPDAMFAGVGVVVLGMTWGFVVIFRHWYLDEYLSAEASQFGIIEAIRGLCGLPIFIVSSWLIRKIGKTHVILLALCFKAMFCYGYSFLHAVWPAFFLELTVTISFHLLLVSLMYFCQSISPPGLYATVNALSGTLHFSLGRILGGAVGGSIMIKFGGRLAFMVLGSVNVITAIIYGSFLLLRHKYRMEN